MLWRKVTRKGVPFRRRVRRLRANFASRIRGAWRVVPKQSRQVVGRTKEPSVRCSTRGRRETRPMCQRGLRMVESCEGVMGEAEGRRVERARSMSFP